MESGDYFLVLDTDETQSNLIDVIAIEQHIWNISGFQNPIARQSSIFCKLLGCNIYLLMVLLWLSSDFEGGFFLVPNYAAKKRRVAELGKSCFFMFTLSMSAKKEGGGTLLWLLVRCQRKQWS